MTDIIITALLAYLLGSVPFGLLIGRFCGIDIRHHGSGNIGATNVTRVLGRDWGVFCFVLDFGKGLVPVVIARWLTDSSSSLPIFAAAAAICGHIWPIYLKFKGGKGVATSIGALVALALWPVICAVVTWYVVFQVSRYVSVASITAAIMLPLSTVFIDSDPPVVILLSIIALLILVRHRTNVIRLLEGRENRFTRKPKESK